MDFADGLNKPFLELGLGHVIRQDPSRKRVIWGEFNKVTTYKDGKACRESTWVQYPMVSKSRALAPLAWRVGCVGERFPEPRDKCTTGTDRLWGEGCGERAVGRGCGERACPMTLGEGSSQSARRGPERTLPWPYSSPALWSPAGVPHCPNPTGSLRSWAPMM